MKTFFDAAALWFARRLTIARLRGLEPRLLADMGVPADDIEAYVFGLDRRRACPERPGKRCGEATETSLLAMPLVSL